MLSLKNNCLHLIDTLWLGGAQGVLKDVFENNQEKKLFLLALRETDDMIAIDHPQVQTVKNCNKWNFRKPLLTVLKLIQEHNIQTIHCHLPKSQLTGVLIKTFYQPGIKLIFQEQGDITDPLPANLPAYWLGRGKINKIICCSNHVRQTLRSKTQMRSSKLDVIYNFNSMPLHQVVHQPLHGVFKIGFAGRFIERKGWKDLLKACKILSKRSAINVELHVAGTGPDEKKFKEWSEEATPLKVVFHGFVKQMRDFYQRVQVLCVPSHWEPVGMVHLEAMASGVPVIASNVPGMNELLAHEQNAILFPPKNIEALVNALERLMQDDALRIQMIQHGRITAKTYDYVYFEQHLQRVYAEVEC